MPGSRMRVEELQRAVDSMPTDGMRRELARLVRAGGLRTQIRAGSSAVLCWAVGARPAMGRCNKPPCSAWRMQPKRALPPAAAPRQARDDIGRFCNEHLSDCVWLFHAQRSINIGQRAAYVELRPFAPCRAG